MLYDVYDEAIKNISSDKKKFARIYCVHSFLFLFIFFIFFFVICFVACAVIASERRRIKTFYWMIWAIAWVSSERIVIAQLQTFIILWQTFILFVQRTFSFNLQSFEIYQKPSKNEIGRFIRTCTREICTIYLSHMKWSRALALVHLISYDESIELPVFSVCVSDRS